MAIQLDFDFERTSPNPIDSSFVLTKAEMLAIDDNKMPDKYFAVCKDDGAFYLYDKSATPSATTGKFAELKGGGGGEEGKTYTMDWDESAHELTLTDGTTPQNLELTGLQSELTAGSNISIVEDPYTGTTVISSTGGSGTGNADFALDTTNNSATISNNTQGIGFDLSETNIVTMTASEPGTYQNSKVLATKDYVDNNMPVIVGSDWGVAKEGFARIPNSSSGGATVDVDISDLNLASDDDYEVLFVGMSDSIYVLSRMTATSFTVRREAASPTVSTVIRYVVFAKGYGSTPSGGTTGQVLTKKSNVDGDVEWADGGSGGSTDATVLKYGESTFAEAQAAIIAGDKPSIIWNIGEGFNRHIVYTNSYDSGNDYVDFFGLVSVGATPKFAFVEVDDSNNWTYQFTDVNVDIPLKTINNQSIKGTGNIDIVGGASVQVNSTGEFGQTREGDNLISFSDNGTNVDMQMAKGSTANNLTLTTKDYVDGRTGINFAVGKETWYGTYTDENNVTYQVYTKTVYIPALPSTAGITTYPHGVSNIKQILSIYGFTTDGFVLNAPRQTTSDNITIYQASKSASNQTFSIEVGKDRSSKSAYVTMVYAKNN